MWPGGIFGQSLYGSRVWLSKWQFLAAFTNSSDRFLNWIIPKGIWILSDTYPMYSVCPPKSIRTVPCSDRDVRARHTSRQGQRLLSWESNYECPDPCTSSLRSRLWEYRTELFQKVASMCAFHRNNHN